MTTRAKVRLRRGVATGLVRWIVGVILISSAVTGLLALLARVAGPAAWTARRPSNLVLRPNPLRTGDSATLFADIDAYVTREMRAVRAPGVALAIVRGGQLAHMRGFGIAGPSGRPVTPETPFILGSLSKSFTALAVMQLVEGGRVALDAPVQQYLPWFHVHDDAASGRITVRQLLNHTSGIPMSAGLLIARGSRAATPADQARLARSFGLHDTPGRRFEYSNANYWLLGLIVERVSGMSYESYVQQNIFTPLGMRNSFTSEDSASAHGLAQGYRVWFGFPRAENLPYYSRELAVGYLISTPEDMGQYLIAHLDGRPPQGATILSREGFGTLHAAGPGTPYAMGWLVDTIAGRRILWHTGSVANYHCDMLLVPDADAGVIIMANVNNFLLETQFGEAIKGVGALLLGYEPSPRSMIRYRETYWIILAAACLWVLWRASQLAAFGPWQPLPDPNDRANSPALQPHVTAVLLDPGLSIGLIFGARLFLGSPLSTLRWFVPDLTDWMLLNVAVSVVIAWCRLALTPERRMKARQPSVPSGAGPAAQANI